MRRRLEIIELPLVRGPDKCEDEAEAQKQGHRNHQKKNIHRIPRTDEITKSAELIGIKIAATMGLI